MTLEEYCIANSPKGSLVDEYQDYLKELYIGEYRIYVDIDIARHLPLFLNKGSRLINRAYMYNFDEGNLQYHLKQDFSYGSDKLFYDIRSYKDGLTAYKFLHRLKTFPISPQNAVYVGGNWIPRIFLLEEAVRRNLKNFEAENHTEGHCRYDLNKDKVDDDILGFLDIKLILTTSGLCITGLSGNFPYERLHDITKLIPYPLRIDRSSLKTVNPDFAYFTPEIQEKIDRYMEPIC